MRLTGGIVLGALLVAGAARADEAGKETFEAQATGATRLDREGLTGLVWAVTATCDGGDELAERQCRAVQAARRRAVAGKRFVVAADAAALTVGAFDGKTQSVPLTLSGCVACVEPIAVDGKPYYVVSKKAAPTFTGAVAKAATIHETDRTFANEEAATAWRTGVVPRLRTELVVDVAADGGVWTRDGKHGLAVDVVAYRVYDPCEGEVVAAHPRSEKAAVDRAACGDAVVEGDAAPAKAAPVEAIPDALSADQIKAAMQPVRGAAEQCFAKYGVAGDAKLKVTVAADGSVVAVEVKGDFAGTPTGACIEQAAKAVAFPRTKKSRQSFSYPVVLR